MASNVKNQQTVDFVRECKPKVHYLTPKIKKWA
jgi:hypothetical protein